MAAVTICSDFGAPKKSVTVSTASPSICHEVPPRVWKRLRVDGGLPEEACFSGVTSPMAGWGAPLTSGSSCRRGGRRCTDQASHVWGPCPWVQHQKMPGTQAGLQKGLRCVSGEALHPEETWAFREGWESVPGYRIDLPGRRELGARISGEL